MAATSAPRPIADEPGAVPRTLLDRLVRRLMSAAAVARARGGARDLVWRVRGRRFANPPLPARIDSLLFVCKGNICRSPFAALRAEQLLTAAGRRDVRCGSAGLWATQGARPPREACEAGSAFDLSLEAHEPVKLTDAAVDGYGLIVVMEAGQLAAMRASYPRAASKTVLLPLVRSSRGRRGYASYNIEDPYGLPLEAFERCYRRLDEDVRALLLDARLLPSSNRRG